MRKFKDSLLCCFSRVEALAEIGRADDCADCLGPGLVAGGVVVLASQELMDDGRSELVCIPIAAKVVTSGEKVSSNPVTCVSITSYLEILSKDIRCMRSALVAW